MIDLYQLFEKSIDRAHLLDRTNKIYKLDESNLPYQFRADTNKTFGFKIDNVKIFSASPPKGIAKMCDVLFVVKHKENDFIIAVEIKTKHKGEYKQQIENGHAFCRWLIGLLKNHKYYTGKPRYLGLRVMQQNPSEPSKNTTTPLGNKIKKMNHLGMYCYLGQDISLRELLDLEYKA